MLSDSNSRRMESDSTSCTSCRDDGHHHRLYEASKDRRKHPSSPRRTCYARSTNFSENLKCRIRSSKQARLSVRVLVFSYAFTYHVHRSPEIFVRDISFEEIDTHASQSIRRQLRRTRTYAVTTKRLFKRKYGIWRETSNIPPETSIQLRHPSRCHPACAQYANRTKQDVAKLPQPHENADREQSIAPKQHSNT